ncbi:MAG: hypothetical protein HOC23_22640 [Halieaceae bacterium]|nr:hypothetical protein [Halieaceae bacterium]
MNMLTALGGGFSSFFSIWQACILQISPFFMVYLVGLYLATEKSSTPSGRFHMLLPCIAYTLGFSIIYALLSARGLGTGRLLISHINNLRMVAGVFIALISLHFMLSVRIKSLAALPGIIARGLLPLLVGLSFAIIYSPCVTPIYAKILQIAVVTETATRGATLAWAYGVGMGLSFTVVGLLLVFSLRNMPFQYKARASYFCATVLGILALMNITGVMVYYKAFFLGLLV